MSPIYYFIFLFLLIFLLGFTVEYFLSYVFSEKAFRYFVAPGIFLHESAHALTAFIFGGKIIEFRIFDAKGGSVKYSQPKLANFTNIIIGLAPIIVGVAVLLLINKVFNIHLLASQEGIISFKEIKNIFLSLNYSSWLTYLYLYLSLSIAASMAPSKQDLSLSWAGLILFLIIMIFLYFWVTFTQTYFLMILPSLIWAVNLLIIFLIVVAILYAIKWIFIMSIAKIQNR